MRPTGSIPGLMLAVGAGLAPPAVPALAETVEEIVVTATRRNASHLELAGNVSRLEQSRIEAAGHHHIHELMVEIPGTWISRGSGQEHLTAIRSPVLTGAGSCGAFLFLEDGIPVRPSGFCNVNQLFELNTEQAAAIEVIRGPGSAFYGSNSLHGLINVITPDPRSDRSRRLSAEAGPNDYFRGAVAWHGGDDLPWSLRLHGEHDGGFRARSGYGQAKLNLGAVTTIASQPVRWSFAATDLDQETAGFIIGEDAYEDRALNRSNPNPEAFRNAEAQRLSARWRAWRGEDTTLDVTAYARRSEMEFLQHFLPGQPLEENGHYSTGLNLIMERDGEDDLLLVGLDLEFSDSYLRETQAGPVTDGSPFLIETRPEGKHYDYDVTSWSIAPFVHWERSLDDRLTMELGLRLEHLVHDYDNLMIDGNTRDDGTPCGFGGCLYTRPGDRSDRFTNLAPKLGMNYRLGAGRAIFASLRRGFRAPQATELYRLQSGQSVADLEAERADSLEAGFRQLRDGLSLEATAFMMRKRSSVLRDAAGFNVSNGESRHLGLELSLDWTISETLALSFAGSWMRQTYEFDLVAQRGETFVDGNIVDTAPATLANLALRWTPRPELVFGADLTHQGSYYLDAENRFRYPGHELLDLTAEISLAPPLRLRARLNNVADRDYADRADFAFGNFRYFPGRGRELYVELAWQFGQARARAGTAADDRS